MTRWLKENLEDIKILLECGAVFGMWFGIALLWSVLL